MPSRRRTPVLLALALAALLALCAAPAVAGASPAAQAAAGRCPRRAARARGCRRAARGRRGAARRGVAPAPFTPLFSEDRRLVVLVTLRSSPGKPPQQYVDVRWGSVQVTCSSGPRTALLATSALLRGSSFASDVTEPSGARKHLRGRFTSSTRAVGEVRVTFADLRGGTCDSGLLRFTVST